MASTITSPESLVAIIIAARRAKDKELERKAKRVLQEKFGVTLCFAQPDKVTTA